MVASVVLKETDRGCEISRTAFLIDWTLISNLRELLVNFLVDRE